jgi:triosephosphate isomerase (TIM)
MEKRTRKRLKVVHLERPSFCLQACGWYTVYMILVLNWKMKPETLREAKKIFEATKTVATRSKKIKTIVAPPAFFLHPIASSYKGRTVSFAAQNIHEKQIGSFTGEVSATQAHDVGATYAIVGHSERRKIGESDDDVRKKVAIALATGLSPVICIGENMRDHSGEYLEVVKRQVAAALSDVQQAQVKKVIIAYEPVWAIGADEPMEATLMHEMTIFIRKLLWERYGKTAMSVPILYGGAILDDEHAVEMVKESEVNGFILGRASVDMHKLPILFAALSRA